MWALPKLSAQNGILRGVFGNWIWSVWGQAQSGDPFTATAGGTDLSHTGIGQDRAQTVAGQNPYGSGACTAAKITTPCVDYLNVSAFTQPAAGTFGNAVKDALVGPGLFSWDMGLIKNLPFSEKWHAQFRAEFFNVFNRANFNNLTNANNPTNRRNSKNFGTIISAQDPRIGQVALKIIF